MSATNDNAKLFDSRLIAELIKNGVVYRLYENKIYHVVIPSYNEVGMELIENGYEFLNTNGGGRFYNIFQFSSFSDIKPEIREWAADTSGNNYTYTDAIVIDSLPQKIMADFYLKVNRPKKPTKIFYSIENAAKWTLEQIEELKSKD